MISEKLGRFRSWRKALHRNGAPRHDEQPLRAELYTVEQLARHARALAAADRIATGSAPDRVNARLDENETLLVETYDLVTAAVDRKRRIPPAAEWLLDNFYLIEEQIRTARRHLPQSYSRQLPRLASGPAVNFPRSYGIALELISHVDGRLDADSLDAFIAAYQTITPLLLGELWAIPIMLRLALIENLRRVAACVAEGRRDQDLAGDWAERMVQVVEKNPTDLVLVLADMARANPSLTGAFLAELTRRLQGQSPHFTLANSWLELRLAADGQTTERLVISEGQAQAADQVSMGNSINSLRFLSSNDWRTFVETHSIVEKTLRQDPLRIYDRADFATRDRCRHAIEKIAKRSTLSEHDVARTAIRLAQAAAEETPGDRTGHVGYYLIDRGRDELERQSKLRFSARALASRFGRRFPLFLYLSAVVVLTGGATAVFLLQVACADVGLVILVCLALPALWSASHLGVGLANWLATLLARPLPLPRMDFRERIPAEHRTLVVVPTMLSSAAAVEDLLQGLEVRYLANSDDHLHFALLTDFPDAIQEVMPTDEVRVGLARAGIEQLNQRYAGERTDIFFLFHRPRKWNAQEGVWMGRERKRGKLADLNAFLRGAGQSGSPPAFSHVIGETTHLPAVQYVITLDTDTQLPRDAAREMVGALAHPLNRPVLDSECRRVVEGYGILQPRVGVSLPSSHRSWFVRLFGGDAGVDPYTRVVSDVYQDLFAEGSFIGKGIYDVDAFEQTCSDFPDNTILSHDLLESTFARSALLSDVELYEDYPSRYPADVSRRRRWMRGDWQIVWWLLPWIPRLDGGRRPNPISALSWWKIFDNLRRSVVPIAMLVVLLGSWLFAPPPLAAAAVVFVLAVTGAAPLLAVLGDLVRKPRELPLFAHARATIGVLATQIGQVLFGLVFLAYDAYISFDAILRTLLRMLWTKKKLLVWMTSGDAEHSAGGSLAAYFRTMWFSPAVAAGVVGLLMFKAPGRLPAAAPLLVAWCIGPAVAWWLSRTLAPPEVRLSDAQRIFLQKMTRRTWRFFETCVTAEENWLAPDNVQEHPTRLVAPRTSPTNIGLALLADLAACDFGFCTAGRLIEQTQKTFSTLARLERYAGHFYNWYDTRTLLPLSPLYVSTVDSGNLAGSLIALRGGLLELADAKVLAPRLFGGLRDTLRVLLDEARGAHRGSENNRTSLVPADILHKIERIEETLQERTWNLNSAAALLSRLVTAGGEISAIAGHDAELAWWAAAFESGCVDHRDDLFALAGWAELPALSEDVRRLEVLWRNGGLEPLERLRDLKALLGRLDGIPTLRELAAWQGILLPALDAILGRLGNPMEDIATEIGVSQGLAHARIGFDKWRRAIADSSQRAAARMAEIEQLADECGNLIEMDFSFLFDESRDLFAIGYNVSSRRRDGSYYDLLASEARLASFLTIAQGKVGQEHWFALGRMLTKTEGEIALLSWSGSMFEYLMPLLVMPSYENTLLDQTCRAVVRRQVEYGRQRGVPWGISECGYNAIDVNMNYQYRAFGVPGLGLKRGLAEDLVIAPYASFMALMVSPEAACRNLERLASEGYAGSCGFFEAIDFTPSRLPRGMTRAIVRQFMAHHEGMSLLSAVWLLLDRPMQRRFAADPMMRAADLLLQERVPKSVVPVFPHVAEAGATRTASAEEHGTMQVFTDAGTAAPEVNLLSNGRYHVMITSAGGGYSRWHDLAVTRWREDFTRDNWGMFCYLRDLDSGTFWSTAWQPTLTTSRQYEAIFTQARAEFRRRDEKIDTHTEISVSPEDDVELRRITITNRSDVARTIELTSYAEVVLAPVDHDLAHPAFSNLFVQTEIVPGRQAILCTRRPRSNNERPPWLVHLMTVQGTTLDTASYETDRMKFTGRGRTLVAPAAMSGLASLSGSQGPVLDPIVSIRHVIRVEPNEIARIDLVTGVAESREAITSIMEKYYDPRLGDRVFELAWTHSHILLRQLNASEIDAQAYGRLAGSVIYASARRRASAAVLARNRRGQSGLWGYGISGDLPIVLVRIRESRQLDLVRQAVQAHAYWRMKGLIVDLVIWNEDDSVYRQSLQDSIMDVVTASPEAALVDRPGGLFVRRGEQMSEEDRALLQTVARVVLLDDAGTLIEQVERRSHSEVPVPPHRPVRRRTEPALPSPDVSRRDLLFFNGLGGFSRDGREYIIVLRPGETTPAPWINVIANAQFGTVVSENGSVYTWSENCHEFRLTPWSNDPVSDTSGESLYLRDEENGRFWSPSPAPARGLNPYVIRHGFGYSVFEYVEEGIATELCVYVATDAPVKFVRIKIRNRSGRRRQLSVTGCWEWVLGELRSKTLLHVVTELDAHSGALFARNTYSPEFADRIVFVDSSESNHTVTADRTEFFGRNGTPANPAAMRRARLSGRVGAGLDPCAAMQVMVDLAEGQEKDVVFVLGAAQNEDHARHLLQRFRSTGGAQQAQEGVWHYWSRTLGVAHFETPDPAINVLANGWLLYQILACRMWARTGFYQSGGAFGFRDQLQDAMALVHAEPGLLREHLLRAAAHQFREGDVQHWWHPPVGRGVRTHFSDDFLWLPCAVCRYVAATGDTGVLDERVPFVSARAVRPEEDAYYDLPQVSDDVGSLYDHCLRAVDHALRFGTHGLPLMGGGDWNDGMNLVGAKGTGESVWLGFFLYDILTRFAVLARSRGDEVFADKCTIEAGRLRGNLEEHAWDGEWYLRAYFDDGTPLGSSANVECRIDALPQSWSILSGAGTRERAQMAMESVDRLLVRRDARLIQVLEPPFDKSPLDPGYIRGYVPGVRENGGQYTHAAIWTVMAFAAMGDSRRAWELLSLINPVNHSSTPEKASLYRVEPYVVAADVYGVAPHTGRGGWTWYTGSAGWLYRLITESLLGFHRDVDKLRFSPCLPAEWPELKIHYRFHETEYHITIRNGGNGTTVQRVILDGVEQSDITLPLIDDRNNHNAEVELG
jgi:cellobiose phosphorylase